jgi:hypothetical protein
MELSSTRCICSLSRRVVAGHLSLISKAAQRTERANTPRPKGRRQAQNILRVAGSNMLWHVHRRLHWPILRLSAIEGISIQGPDPRGNSAVRRFTDGYLGKHIAQIDAPNIFIINDVLRSALS